MNPIERIRTSVRLPDTDRHPTIQQFAAAIGCSYGALYNAEQGYTEDPASLIERLTDIAPERIDPEELRAEYIAWRTARLNQVREALRCATVGVD
jgi:hypothetical protein